MKLIYIVFVYCLVLLLEVDACTRMFWNTSDKARLVGRTMDLFISDEPDIWVHPRGICYRSEVEDNGLTWISLYGSVSVSAFRKKNLITDGLNEHGLAVHALALTTTKYEERDSRPALHYGEWLQYLLGMCKNVEEVIASHKTFQVTPFLWKGFIWPLHLMVEDESGDSAIIEFVEGQMRVYHDRKYLVGTNDPTYDIHLKNLEREETLNQENCIDGDMGSVSRFVRASSYLKSLPDPVDADEAVLLMEKTIARLFQKDNRGENQGVDFIQEEELSTSTYWTSISDLTNKCYYFIPVGDKDSIFIDLKNLNFSKGEQVSQSF